MFSFLLFKGSIQEKDIDKIYNTCTVLRPTGEQLAKYRKESVTFIIVTNMTAS